VEELLLSVIEAYKVSDVRQKEIHTAEQLEPDPSPFEFNCYCKVEQL
jgi:hypothetical protein